MHRCRKPLLLLFALFYGCTLLAWRNKPHDTGLFQTTALSIEGEKQVCAPGAVRTYTARVSATCPARVQWTLDNNIGELQILNDSTVRIRFTTAGTAQLKASFTASCATLSNQVQLDYRPMAATLNLGADTSICLGNTLQLQTGGNFASTRWSDGSTASEITVNRTGKYYVAVTDDNVCFQSDTIQVRVRPLPDAELPRDTVLCRPDRLTLQANNRYVKYRWQDGSERSFLIVDQPGTYSVQVTNAFGCVTVDTTVVTRVSQKPTNFALFSDSAICMGQPVTLRVAGNFVRYNWNFGASASPQFQANQPGTYTIEVHNTDGCAGIDTIVLRDEGCGQAVVVPNAFSPNGDGLNDLFRPKVYGNFDFYRLEVYNRWGQLLFVTNNPGTGWNGRFQQAFQPSDTYAWYLRYRYADGAQVMSQKGTVVLIR